MKKIVWIAVWEFIWIIGGAQETLVKVFEFPIVPATSKNVQLYNDRIYTIVNTACNLGDHYVVCSSLIELTDSGDTLWLTLIPDIDVASGSMVIVNDTITVTGNNEPLTAWRMAHFDLNGQKLGETIEIEHPQKMFWNMFQLTTQYFNNKFVICGSGWEVDTIWSLMFIVNRSGMIDTLISLERSDRLSACWDSYIDSEGRLTTYHQVEFYRPPGPGPPRINYRKIFKFDTSYDTVWTYRSENSESNDVIPYGCELHDGRTILSYTNPLQERNLHSVRAINQDGSKDWQHNYAFTGYRNRNIYRLKTLANGDIMGSGSYSERAEDPRIDDSPWLFRMSPEGILLWEKVYYDFDSTIASNGSSRFGALYDFIELEDKSILAVGNLKYNLKSNMLVMRVYSNGCLEPDECDEVIYITEHLMTNTETPTNPPAQFTIHPNPVEKNLYISGIEQVGKIHYVISDINGKSITKGSMIYPTTEINVEYFTPGIYLIQLYDKGSLMDSQKFVKL